MKRSLVLSAVLVLLAHSPLFAKEAASSYVDLVDTPTIAVDWSKSGTQFVTVHGNRTFMFLNGEKGKHYTLVIKQDSTGSRTVTWPSSVHWAGDTPPTLTTTGDKADYIGFIYNGVSYDMLAISQGF